MREKKREDQQTGEKEKLSKSSDHEYHELVTFSFP